MFRIRNNDYGIKHKLIHECGISGEIRKTWDGCVRSQLDHKRITPVLASSCLFWERK